MTSPRPRHERGKPPAAGRPDDSGRRQAAADLQATCGRWVIMWSPWRRCFTGFACFTSQPTIIDEADRALFFARVRQVELASGVGQ